MLISSLDIHQKRDANIKFIQKI